MSEYLVDKNNLVCGITETTCIDGMSEEEANKDFMEWVRKSFNEVGKPVPNQKPTIEYQPQQQDTGKYDTAILCFVFALVGSVMLQSTLGLVVGFVFALILRTITWKEWE